MIVIFFVSGRRGSNSRHSAWKADALPTELLPHFCFQKLLVNGLQIYKKFASTQIKLEKNVGRVGFEPTKS